MPRVAEADMRRLPIDALPAEGGAVALDAATTHRVVHVLRLGAGSPVVLFDGAGHEVDAVVSRAEAGACEVRATGAPRACHPTDPLHLLFGVPKGAPLDNLLRMAVECGATHLHPILTRRTVPKGDHGERWSRIAQAASAQCGRADVPTVSPLRDLRHAVAALPPGLDRRVGVPGGPPAGGLTGPGALCVGPEGGLAPDELSLLLDAGFAPLGLGRWVLRVDTAVVVGLSRWTAG